LGSNGYGGALDLSGPTGVAENNSLKLYYTILSKYSNFCNLLQEYLEKRRIKIGAITLSVRNSSSNCWGKVIEDLI